MQVTVTGRTRDQVESVATEIGGRALVGDVSKREDVERWFAQVGELDILVNNAGTAGPDGPAWENDPHEWWRVFEVNLRGPYLCCREAVPRMEELAAIAVAIHATLSLGTASRSSTASLESATGRWKAQARVDGLRVDRA